MITCDDSCRGLIQCTRNAGSSVNHMREFKRHRDARLGGTIVETNRLVVRLEKVCVYMCVMW